MLSSHPQKGSIHSQTLQIICDSVSRSSISRPGAVTFMYTFIFILPTYNPNDLEPIYLVQQGSSLPDRQLGGWFQTYRELEHLGMHPNQIIHILWVTFWKDMTHKMVPVKPPQRRSLLGSRCIVVVGRKYYKRSIKNWMGPYQWTPRKVAIEL